MNKIRQKVDEDPRNLHLDHSKDGINQHSSLNSNYKSLPIIHVIYYLSPWLCKKQKLTMFTLLIQNPNKNDVDV